MNTAIIRPILKKDNPHIASVIRKVLIDLGVPKIGTAYADVALDSLYEAYQKPKAVYFVIDLNGKIIGGGGISQLDNCEENICELQKMYFTPEIRGTGFAEKIIEMCLTFAKTQGFDICYLETLSFMTAAQKLYKRIGFENIDGPMGNTGHSSCEVWMTKKLV